jgi:RNA polymerase sigma factor (TIGR02999 family)
MAGASAREEHPTGSSEKGLDGTGEITRLLEALGDGDHKALDDLIPLVYDMLRAIARRQLRSERSDHTLSSTALVHEAYLELASLNSAKFAGRAHFFAVAARAMRHILVDHAVQRRAQKRGGNRQRVGLDEIILPLDDKVEDLVAVNDALSRLESMDERLVRVVECRFFAGLTIEETARSLDISEATVSRDWTRARAWLNRELTS